MAETSPAETTAWLPAPTEGITISPIHGGSDSSVGWIIGTVLALIVLLALIWFWRWLSRRRKRYHDDLQDLLDKTGDSFSIEELDEINKVGKTKRRRKDCSLFNPFG